MDSTVTSWGWSAPMPKPKILVIEDERALVEPLTANLAREGFDVLVAHDGQEGLRQAQLKLPDLIVLDLMLPLKGGLEVCRELRMGPRTRDIPVIMVTAKAEESDQLVGFATGADDYVTKPYSMKVLIQRIKKELRRVQTSGGSARWDGHREPGRRHRPPQSQSSLPRRRAAAHAYRVPAARGVDPSGGSGIHPLRADGRGDRRGRDCTRANNRRAHQESEEKAGRGWRAHRNRPRRRLSVS